MEPTLKKFYDITSTDPLFAAEGMDLENAEWALEELEAATRGLEDVWKKTHRWFCFWFPFTETLHPLKFLKEFVKCERARRRFITNPISRNAELLLNAHRKALRALEEDLRAYREALLGIQRLEKFPRDAAIQYFDNMITFSDVLELIDTMLENTRKLNEEVGAREELFFYGASDHQKETSTILPTADTIPIRSGGRPLSPALQEVIERKLKNQSSMETYGPIFYETSLFDPEPAIHQFFVSVLNRDGRPELSVLLADQYYFLDIEEMKDKFFLGMSIYEPLIRRGIPYWNQPATAFYSVFDVGYYADLSAYVDVTRRRKFLAKDTVLKQKSSMLDLLLWTGVTYDEGYTILSKVMTRANELPSLIFTYIARGYPSVYYLPFNRSVWRLPQKLNFTGTRFGEGSHYKTFNEIAHRIPPETLLEVFRGGSYRRKDFNAQFNNS